ncbi:hypothetical protein LCGC14_1752970 [marine sediment metagenome]|uniref:50S ribosomal protein L1 n=1 Tax=marine sediment metagenome TaxID=412755 RepID=A0A0F9K2S3_9ZZZZ
MSSRSKRYTGQAEQVAKETVSLTQAVEKVKSFKAKFDQTVECVLHLGIDPKQADQMMRGAISLPHGIGKAKKVIAFCDDSEIEAAKAAGRIARGEGEVDTDIIQTPDAGVTDRPDIGA